MKFYEAAFDFAPDPERPEIRSLYFITKEEAVKEIKSHLVAEMRRQLKQPEQKKAVEGELYSVVFKNPTKDILCQIINDGTGLNIERERSIIEAFIVQAGTMKIIRRRLLTD